MKFYIASALGGASIFLREVSKTTERITSACSLSLANILNVNSKKNILKKEHSSFMPKEPYIEGSCRNIAPGANHRKLPAGAH